MDLKKEVARSVLPLIRDGMSLGIGDGNTMIHLAELISSLVREGKKLDIFSSSERTRSFFCETGVTIHDITEAETLDLYVDGCDQIDFDLQVLKSGSGIHIMEKLFASMATKFVVLAEETKMVSVFNPKIPLVLEVLPQAFRFVQKKMKDLFCDGISVPRKNIVTNQLQLTRNGNFLIDFYFPLWPPLELVQLHCKQIVGVVEISLFYLMADEALVATANGVSCYRREGGKVLKLR